MRKDGRKWPVARQDARDMLERSAEQSSLECSVDDPCRPQNLELLLFCRRFAVALARRKDYILAIKRDDSYRQSETEKIFCLEGSAVDMRDMWNALHQNECREKAVEALLNQHDVDEARLKADLDRFADDLIEIGTLNEV